MNLDEKRQTELFNALCLAVTATGDARRYAESMLRSAREAEAEARKAYDAFMAAAAEGRKP